VSELADDETEQPTFPLEYVKGLRTEAKNHRVAARAANSHVLEKGYLPRGVNSANSDLNVYINHFPLGDVENYSVCRAAYAKAQSGGRMTGRAWDIYAPWEKQYLEALYKVRFKAQGDNVSGLDGGFLAPEDWNATWFGLLRSQAVFDQLPVTVLNPPFRVEHIPSVSIDISVVYPGENAPLTPTQFQFIQTSYTAHKATALINVSNELIRDGGDMADQLFRDQSARAIATDRDAQLLVGTGAKALGPAGPSAPTGILNHPVIANNFTYYPVTTVSGNITTTPGSFTPSYQHLGQMITKVETLNNFASATIGQATCDGAIAHTQFRQTVWSSARMQDLQARPIWIGALNGSGDPTRGGQGAGQTNAASTNGMLGLKWVLSGAVPNTLTLGGGSNESLIIFGSWANYVLFECLELAYDVTPLGGTSSVGFAADQTQIRVVHRYDGGPAHPEAFGVLAGVLV
jgi:HK97 family phage major capsid protein